MFYDIYVTWISGHITYEKDVTHSRVVELQKSPSVVEVEIEHSNIVPSWSGVEF